MIPNNLAVHQGKTGAGSEKRAEGGAACVEIVGFPQILYLRTSGDPDTLFVPLLDATRDALSRMEHLASQGNERSHAISLCGMHLASSLMRDSHFSLGARGLSPENAYTVNFEAGTLHVVARLYSVVNRRISFFKVELAGNIAGGPFVVRNPVQGTIILQVEEDKFRQPKFFASTLADECVRAQMDYERSGRVQESHAPNAHGEVRMLLTVDGKRVQVILRQKEQGSGWDIVDGKRQECIGSLSAEIEQHLGAVTDFVQNLFNE